ncbi:hypothetical protein IIE63_000738 [Listeria monocytogenes]|uniref:Uncharacterized protein n=1 Tax=Listeria monocytogenes TaxID=1639 RepID=A0A823IZL7_LISMN|nr:hypothetical protein [Listeria monocytogenes]EAD5297543.1 hypothetical protein [Listeria monocytogenes]EAE7386148.1 hypothetical protein [Listeria monocytogenes]EAG9222932.1 hypothetical protein [Listeria monocytogenes]EAG9354832.1 hypothetical protein [Listeria monocytogenes]EGN0214370.1 hypothetical protein [Listeria monocytogenes]
MPIKKKIFKINYKKIFVALTSIVSIIFPIIVTLYIFSYDKSNSPIVIDETVVSLKRLDSAKLPITIKNGTNKMTNGISANLSIDVKCQQGTVENAYYISPTPQGEINTSSFNHVYDLSNYVHEIKQVDSTFYHVIPFYLLLVDKEQNLTINYYHIIANSTIFSNQVNNELTVSTFDLVSNLYTISYYDLISDEVFKEQNAEIKTLLKNNKNIDLAPETAQIDMEKVRKQMKLIKNIYNDFY